MSYLVEEGARDFGVGDSLGFVQEDEIEFSQKGSGNGMTLIDSRGFRLVLVPNYGPHCFNYGNLPKKFL